MSVTDLTAPARADEYRARLASLWERNLGTAVTDDDDYFRAGGDSLLGTQLIIWIEENFGVELSLLDIFESRTVAAQTQLVLERLATSGPAAERRPVEYDFFGPPGARLFGAMHRPQAGRAAGGVLLCYPMGQEYMRIHRTYVELARSLAAAGFYALRFDYYGCGDSAGDSDEGDFARWSDDIRLAADELRSRAGVRDLFIVGSRVGANLVLDVSRDGGFDAAGLVLWEPIVSGAHYLAALRRAHHDLLASNAILDGYEQRARTGYPAEFVGFPLPQKLYDEVAGIDLLATARGASLPPALLLTNSDKPALGELAAVLVDGRRNELDCVTALESDGIWLREDRQNKGLIPARAIQAVVSWVSRRAA